MTETEVTPERLLDHKVAIVTGAAKGIGRGIAIGMAKEGAAVALVDIDSEGLQETDKQIHGFGGNTSVHLVDISNIVENDRLVDEVIKQHGSIDILVNNAGINTEGGILDITKEGALSVLNTNLVGPFFLTQRGVKEMKSRKTKGSVLFTSSVHGHITQLHPAYTTSKAALEMFVKDTALELAEYGIRVNAVAPGAIAIRGEQDKTNPHVPLGYSGTPEDIANTMIFLASNKGAYITGQTIVVDGGFSLAHTNYWIKKGKL